ncbi:MAG: type III pantothenate kinase [Bacteroidales bacterium]|nr:type III pantothenate kinase [Bacteroidales bacterium]
MNIVIDFGNTRCKFYFFDNQRLSHTKIVENSDPCFSEKMLNIVNDSKISDAIISSVASIPDSLIALLSKCCNKVIVLNSDTSVPISNSYDNPKLLGNDRLAAAVGATVLFPGRDVLVVDAGTAITYEFVSGQNRYLGGSISPGLGLRFASLHEHTAKLPLVQPNTDSEKLQPIRKVL